MAQNENYSVVDLRIGTEAQFNAKVDTLPAGTLFGVTDATVSKADLSTDLKNEINGKLTKPTNPSAESAVTMLADGTVGTKPLSEIGDFINIYGESSYYARFILTPEVHQKILNNPDCIIMFHVAESAQSGPGVSVITLVPSGYDKNNYVYMSNIKVDATLNYGNNSGTKHFTLNIPKTLITANKQIDLYVHQLKFPSMDTPSAEKNFAVYSNNSSGSTWYVDATKYVTKDDIKRYKHSISFKAGNVNINFNFPDSNGTPYTAETLTTPTDKNIIFLYNITEDREGFGYIESISNAHCSYYGIYLAQNSGSGLTTSEIVYGFGHSISTDFTDTVTEL